MELCGPEKYTEVLFLLQLMKQGMSRKSCLQSPIIQDFCMAEHQTGLTEIIPQLGDYNYVLVERKHKWKRRDSFRPGWVVALIFRSGFYMALVTPWPGHLSSVLREEMLGKPDSQSGEETLPCCGPRSFLFYKAPRGFVLNRCHSAALVGLELAT